MADEVVLREPDRYRLLIITALFSVFIFGYMAYSVAKFKVLQSRSVVKGNVVMKVIQHNVRSVCPKCGSKGIPLCPTCSQAMYWNGYSGTFVCPACGKGGFPRCPRCSEYMSWIEAQ